MNRAFVLTLLITGVVLVLVGPAAADTPGDGQTNIDRMPWLDGGSRELDQGWFGHTSHYSQYGEDWRLNGNSFAVHSATESLGNASCVEWDGRTVPSGGTYVTVGRTSGNLTDWYFHLPQGTCSSYPKHLEQGDFLANAGNTGTGGIHLHYEPRGPGGLAADSVYHCLSGLRYMYFCDHADPIPPSTDGHDGELGFQCTQGFNSAWYVSDNAGPGQGAGNAYIGAGMALTYRNIGHFWCGASHAWNCNGSSTAYFGGTEKAYPGYQGGEWTWHQQFVNSGGAQGNLSAPNACGGGIAYWVPHNNFIAWLNNTWLGQPRSGYYYTGLLWVQYFRYGYLYSYSFGGTAYPLAAGPYSCQ